MQKEQADGAPFQYKVRQGPSGDPWKTENAKQIHLFHIVENQRMFKSKLCIGWRNPCLRCDPFNFCTLAIIFFFVAWFPPISNKKHNSWTWRAHPPICKCTFASLEIHFQLGKIQFLILTNTSLYLAKVSKGGCTVQLRCELSNLPASHCKSFSSFSEYYQNPNCFFRIWILQSKKKPIQPSTIWMLKGNSEKQICTVCAMLGVLRANKNLRRSHWQSSPAPADPQPVLLEEEEAACSSSSSSSCCCWSHQCCFGGAAAWKAWGLMPASTTASFFTLDWS